MVSPSCVIGFKAGAILARSATFAVGRIDPAVCGGYNPAFPGESARAEFSSPFFLVNRLLQTSLINPSLGRKAVGKTANKATSQPTSKPTSQPTSKRTSKTRSESAGDALRAPRQGSGVRAERPARPIPEGPRLGWREAIAGTVGGLGYELVEVERAQRGLLRITIDRVPGHAYPVRHTENAEAGVLDSGEFITVDDCEQVTRQLQYALEVEGMEYARLEVSSPGLDRPLKNEEHLQRFVGHAVSVTLKVPFQGRKNWQGVLGLGAAKNNGWQLLFKDGAADQVFGFKFDEVREAHLVPVVDFKGRKAVQDARTSGPVGLQSSDQAGTAPSGAIKANVPGEDGG
jgi:ribosome maturation factor RimP